VDFRVFCDLRFTICELRFELLCFGCVAGVRNVRDLYHPVSAVDRESRIYPVPNSMCVCNHDSVGLVDWKMWKCGNVEMCRRGLGV
jgi:hypothetical protein